MKIWQKYNNSKNEYKVSDCRKYTGESILIEYLGHFHSQMSSYTFDVFDCMCVGKLSKLYAIPILLLHNQ